MRWVQSCRRRREIKCLDPSLPNSRDRRKDDPFHTGDKLRQLRVRDKYPLERVAAELGVRYLLMGRVRRAGQRLWVGVELVQAATRQVIWQERYEGSDDEVFDFQARIAASIAAAIDPRLVEAEIAMVRGQPRGLPTGNFSAYDDVLRGLACLYQPGPDDFAAAGQFFRHAVLLDPDYAQAHAHLAWWHNLRVGEGRSDAVAQDAGAAREHALRAMQLDPRDAVVLSVAGHLLSFLDKAFEQAHDIFEQALALNPNCAVAWARSATTLAYRGHGEKALERVRNAMRLSPFDPNSFAFLTTCGTAAFVAGRTDEAVAWLGKALRLNPRYNAARRLLIAALVLTDDIAEAQERAAEFLTDDPTFSVSAFGAWYPLQAPHLERMLEALRRAGLPA